MGNDGLTVSLDGENMATYCTQLAQKHDVSKKKTGKFKTTAGSTIDVPVAAAGQTVDGNKLYESIYKAIDEKKSATVEAVYSDAKVEETGEFVTYGGNYCEVDLTNQMAYVNTMDAKELWNYFSDTEKYKLKQGKAIEGFMPDWIGEFYAYYQWYYDIPSAEIINKVSVDFLRKAYYGLHDLELDLAVKKVGKV